MIETVITHLMIPTVGGPAKKLAKNNWFIGGLLTIFVGGTYLSTIRRVSSDDLEKELERELEEEDRRQAKLLTKDK